MATWSAATERAGTYGLHTPTPRLPLIGSADICNHRLAVACGQPVATAAAAIAAAAAAAAAIALFSYAGAAAASVLPTAPPPPLLLSQRPLLLRRRHDCIIGTAEAADSDTATETPRQHPPLQPIFCTYK